jgi:protein-disulfide isomerase
MHSRRLAPRTLVALCATALLTISAAHAAAPPAPGGGAAATAGGSTATAKAPAAAAKAPGPAAAPKAPVSAGGAGSAPTSGGAAAATARPADGSVLDRPTGTNVAIVVFEDLQCPDCRAAHPLLLQASKTEDVPLVIKDFPIQRHEWAFPAAILAKWFEYESPELGLRFREFAFANQELLTPANLRDAAEQFARLYDRTLPENIDPEGKLQSRVQNDVDLGALIGLRYVPLIFVVGQGKGAERFREVTDPSKLGETVREFKQKAALRGAAKAR